MSPIEIFTPEEAIGILKMRELGYTNPEKTLRGLVWSKKIECTKVGRKVVFTRQHINAYLSRKNSPEAHQQLKPRRRRRSPKPPETPPC